MLPELPSASLPNVESAIANYTEQWSPGGQSLGSTCLPDEKLMAERLRPAVFEEVRAALDPVMRADLIQLKVCLMPVVHRCDSHIWQAIAGIVCVFTMEGSS